MKLTPHQQHVFDELISDIENFNDFGQCFVGALSGPAGSGKSTTTAEIINYLLNSTKDNIAVTAPTHKALKVLNDMTKRFKNKRLKVSTIHSYLRLKMERVGDQMKLAMDRFSKVKNDDVKILIIDESSMVSGDLYKFINDRIKSSNLKIVLFIGDKYQLNPVDGKQNPVYHKVKQYELTEVVRQAQYSDILMKATQIRQAIEQKNFDMNILKFSQSKDIIVYNKDTDLLKDFCLNPNNDKIMSAFTNNTVDYYNKFVRSYIHRDLDTIPDLVEGEVLTLQEAYYPNQSEVGVRNGDTILVTLLQKDYDEDLGVYYWSFENDDLDYRMKVITSESSEVIKKKLSNYADRAKSFQQNKMFAEMNQEWDKFWSLKDLFADVKHSHASTIHKLQGSTVSEIYINIKDTINSCRDKEDLFRLIYVALTRATDKVKILQ